MPLPSCQSFTETIKKFKANQDKNQNFYVNLEFLLMKVRLEIVGLSYSQTQSSATDAWRSSKCIPAPIIIRQFWGAGGASELRKSEPQPPSYTTFLNPLPKPSKLILPVLIPWKTQWKNFYAKLICSKRR